MQLLLVPVIFSTHNHKMPKLELQQFPSTPTFGNNISAIINKFEHTKNYHSPLVTTNARHIIHPTKHIIDNEMPFSTADRAFEARNRKRKLTTAKRSQPSESKMFDTNVNDSFDDSVDNKRFTKNNTDLIDVTTCDENDLYVGIDGASILADECAYEEFDDVTVIPQTKLMRLKNINLIRCQLNLFQRMVGIVLCFPFFSSINGAGLTTLACAFFLPRILCENILYPIFRLILGTLYPAYASYKAVRNKDVKDYVSIFLALLLFVYACFFYFHAHRKKKC